MPEYIQDTREEFVLKFRCVDMQTGKTEIVENTFSDQKIAREYADAWSGPSDYFKSSHFSLIRRTITTEPLWIDESGKNYV